MTSKSNIIKKLENKSFEVLKELRKNLGKINYSINNFDYFIQDQDSSYDSRLRINQQHLEEEAEDIRETIKTCMIQINFLSEAWELVEEYLKEEEEINDK